MAEHLLEVRNLSVDFHTALGTVHAVRDVSFHLGWTLHRAGPNVTTQPRRVFTIIYMDAAMRLAAPKNKNQQNDWDTWTPSSKVGEVMNDPLNPVL